MNITEHRTGRGIAPHVFASLCLRPAPFPRLRVLVPLVSDVCSAGFPSPADDHIEAVLDLNELLIRNPPSTFFVRAAGWSMVRAGILDGEILIVDRSEPPCHGDIVVACLDGEFCVKWLRVRGRRVWLVPDNDDFQAIEVREGQEFVVWGVVTGKVTQFRRAGRTRKARLQ